MHHSRKRGIITVCVIFICICLVVAGICVLGNLLEDPNVISGKNANQVKDDMDTAYFDGKPYLPKNITTILLVGLDSFGEVESSDSYRNENQADALILLILDHDNKQYKFMNINRDTMAMVDQIGVAGIRYGKAEMQLALAHTYGDGTKISGENTKRAISTFLCGTKIDYFVTMKMDAVALMCDYVSPSGITVTLDKNQDLSDINEMWTPGATISLTGKDALEFIRARKGVEDETNIARMARQKKYIDAFVRAIPEGKSISTSWLDGAYSKIEKYICTDCDKAELYNLTRNVGEYKFTGEIISPEGSADYSSTNARFIVYEDKLNELVRDTFYNPRYKK